MPCLKPNKCEPHCEGNRRCAETGVKERWRKNDNIYYEKKPEPFHIPWNEIIACFGGGNSNLFVIKLSVLGILSPILLTSDGIHDYLSVDEIEDIIDDNGISIIACKKMIEAARQNGSTDDASVIMGGVI